MAKHEWYRKRGKRLLDLFASALALLVLSPLFLVIGVAVRVALGSPVFFRQVRAGKGGRPFTLLKFRSMLPASNETGPRSSDEARLTGFGRLLRRTSLDELPELLHVLRGEMSLVGPRPLLTEYTARYSSFQARRLTVRPGMTGWAQIHGRNDTTWSTRLEHDVWYVDNVSPGLDLKILIRSIPVVLSGSGVTPSDGQFMTEFTGEIQDEGQNQLIGS